MAAHHDSTMGKMPNQMVNSGTRMNVGVAIDATTYDHTPEQNRICECKNEGNSYVTVRKS